MPPSRTTAKTPAKRAGRAARPSLSRERLIDAALEIVEDTGLDGLSLRVLGAHLGVDHTAVYRYFRTKDELLEALGDSVVGGGGPHPETGNPKRRLRAMFANLRHAMLAHPALTPVVVRRPPQGEGTWQGTENALAALRDSGLDDTAAAATYQALLNYTLGHALLEAPYALMTPQQVEAERAGVRAGFAALPADHYPNVIAVAPRFYTDMDTQYLYGLDLLLNAVPNHRHSPKR